VAQLHWGGGTPTYLSPEQMRRLMGALRDRFALDPDAEVAIEVDPRVTTAEHLEALRDLGFQRLSAGVQDFCPEVQEAIGRHQTHGQAVALVTRARELGFASINLDLVYGLPRQTSASFRETLARVVALRPDRLAIYSYAHIPSVKGHQKKLDASALPSPEAKLELLTLALSELKGYVPIGMDHFALPEDELARAAKGGTLWRNFMGYAVRRGLDLIGFGLSAIGDLDGAFFQNHRKLHRYEGAAGAEGIATERGYAPTPDDRLRRHVITALMCNFRVSKADIRRRFGVAFDEAFAPEIETLLPLAADGLVRIEADGIAVTERLFVRNVCMVFDAYLARHRERPRWSRTV
jgi:oxygen-independent coproporphyrinogen-3 oxidase